MGGRSFKPLSKKRIDSGNTAGISPGTSLRVVCERTYRFRKITGSVNEPKLNDPRTNPWTLLVRFPESLCDLQYSVYILYGCNMRHPA